MRPLAYERSKLFDQEAERYDRCRPTYPDVLIDELLGPEPARQAVLDVGCGTGIASRQMAERGAKVLGVEVAPRMAEIARGHGIDVELSAFEDWDLVNSWLHADIKYVQVDEVTIDVYPSVYGPGG